MNKIFEVPLYAYERSPDQDAPTPVRHPVIVIGAGPIGLAAAIDLVREAPPENGAILITITGDEEGDAVDGNQNPRIWVGNDGEHRASYELTARTVKFLGRRDNGAPIGEPPPGGEDEEVLPF